jgi:hypothetical protein
MDIGSNSAAEGFVVSVGLLPDIEVIVDHKPPVFNHQLNKVKIEPLAKIFRSWFDQLTTNGYHLLVELALLALLLSKGKQELLEEAQLA